MSPLSEARRRANKKYNAKAYDEIKVRVNKGRKADVQSHAEARRESVNGFINRAISETMERDGGPSEGSERPGEAKKEE